MPAQRRHETRYTIRFPVELTVGKASLSLVTEDVSFGGLFLKTDTPAPLHQLVKVRLVLPVGDRALRAHGMTVHVVEPHHASGRTPGMGIQFYGLDRETRDAWDAFVHHVESRFPLSADQAPLRLPRGFTPEPVRRRLARHDAVIKLEPDTREELAEKVASMLQTEVLEAPVRLNLEPHVVPGARVVVHIVHPDTGLPFLMEGVVRERAHPAQAGSPEKRNEKDTEAGTEGGLAGGDDRTGLATIALSGLTRAKKESLEDFTRAGVLVDDEVMDAGD